MASTLTHRTSSTRALSTVPTWRRALRSIRRWTRNVALVVSALLLGGTVAGQVRQAQLGAAHPPPGQLVDIGGHRLHVIAEGDGPAVVFENGPGGMALDWALVRPAVAEHAATFTYDRAGIGWSDPGPRPRTIETLVDELHRTLEASDTPAPYVLVGHSFGGLIVRAFAYTHPEQVAGLVLVDAAHEDQYEIYPAEYVAEADRMIESMKRLRPVFWAANASGIPALLGAGRSTTIDRLPRDVAASRHAAGLVDASQAVTTVDEMAELRHDFDVLRQMRRPLGDIPVVVITRGRTVGAEAGVPAGQEDDVHRAWLEMQHDLLTISTNAELWTAHDSGHDIHVERPRIVIDAINHVLGASGTTG